MARGATLPDLAAVGDESARSPGCGAPIRSAVFPGPAPAMFPRVEQSAAVQCPYCGQGFELVLDTSVASQRFITDCEVCCRPFEVAAECEPGEILSLDVRGG